jgi:hypothetical protein
MVEQAANVCCGVPSGHPGLRWLEDLELLSSAGVNDQIFGAFLYSNAVAVAGLRAAARLAGVMGIDATAQRWSDCADRILNRGILEELVSGRLGGPGSSEHEAGRFYRARRVSKLRGLWTDDRKYLVDRSEPLDIFMLGLAVPFGLLPASDPRLVRIAESILRLDSGLKGETQLLSRTTFEPDRGGSSGDQYEVSSLATLWMIRFLIQLGRETGQGRHWMRALGMLEAILGRLSHLGLLVRAPGRGPEAAARPAGSGGTAWRLHSLLIDTLLDLAGLDYDAVDRRLSLRAVLPGPWPQTGLKQNFPCGEVSYLLQRPIGGRVHHLRLKTRLDHPVDLRVVLACPDLKELGPWQASAPMDEPSFDARTGQVAWSLTLPAGPSEWSGTWG